MLWIYCDVSYWYHYERTVLGSDDDTHYLNMWWYYINNLLNLINYKLTKYRFWLYVRLCFFVCIWFCCGLVVILLLFSFVWWVLMGFFCGFLLLLFWGFVWVFLRVVGLFVCAFCLFAYFLLFVFWWGFFILFFFKHFFWGVVIVGWFCFCCFICLFLFCFVWTVVSFVCLCVCFLCFFVCLVLLCFLLLLLLFFVVGFFGGLKGDILCSIFINLGHPITFHYMYSDAMGALVSTCE